jgi:hypothetical protein
VRSPDRAPIFGRKIAKCGRHDERSESGRGCASHPGACASDVIDIEQYSERLDSTQANCGTFELQADADLAIGHGYQRVLKRGTRWHCVGRVSQGDVHATRDQVLTLDRGQTRYVRLNISSGFFVGRVYPELVDDDVAGREIKDLHHTGK